MKNVNRTFLVILLAVGLIFYSSVAMAQNKGGTLKIGSSSSAQSFGYPPLISYGARTQAGPAVEMLIDFDSTGRPIPNLAKDFKISSDGKVFTIFLREGVKFHDGTDCDAEAIKWNMEQFPIAKVAMLTVVESIDVVDKWTVRLNLTRFSNSLFYDLLMSGGIPVSPTAAKKNGIEWTYTHPVGTGPFKFASFQRDAYLKYVRFDDYWRKGKPYLDGVEFHYIQDSVAREMALRSGDIDVNLINPSEARTIKKLKADGFRIKMAPLGVYCLYPDSSNANSPFADKQVREALEYAIDKEAIVDALGHGIWGNVTQIVDNSRMGYCPDIKGRKYDPEKAKQLLAKAGHPNGFKTRIIAQKSFGNDLMVTLKNYLGEVGIDVTIELCDRGKWNQYYYNGWENGLALWLAPSESRSFDALYRLFNAKSNYAVSMLKPENLAVLLEKADQETDPNKMEPIVQDIVRIIHEEALCAPLYLNAHTAAENPKFHDTGIFDESRTFKTYMTLQDAWFSK